MFCLDNISRTVQIYTEFRFFHLLFAIWSSLERDGVGPCIHPRPCIKTCRLPCVGGWVVYGLYEHKSTRAINLSAAGGLLRPTAREQPEAKDVHNWVRKQ